MYKKKGIDILLNGIYEKFKYYRIEDYLLNKFNNNSLKLSDLRLIKDSFFLDNINPYDILEESLKKSVLDIKKLMIRFAEYYCGEFKLYDYVSFHFNNIFSLLAELIKKIYSYFEEEQSLEDIKAFIKLKICQYFNIHFQILNEEKEIKYNLYEFNVEKFKSDFIKLGKLYWNIESNFLITDLIVFDINTNLEKKIFTINYEIDPKRIILSVCEDLKLSEIQSKATNHEKLMLSIFYISYTCDELISSLYNKNNLNGSSYKYKSINDFYYKVSLSYNSAINGFLDIKNEMNNKIKELKEFEKKNYKNYNVEEKENDGEESDDESSEEYINFEKHSLMKYINF